MQQSPLAPIATPTPIALGPKIALVTGAGRGIGRATALRLAAAGCRVALTARTTSELDSAVAEIHDMGGAALGVAADVAEEAAVDTLFDRVAATFGGPVELLVNNAGAIRVAELVRAELVDLRRVLDTNVVGTWLCSRALFRRLIPTGRRGAIVNLSSLGGLFGTAKFPGMSGYVASKFAIAGLTEQLAVEGKPHGIRVNCVAPGAVDTQMLREAAPFLKTSTTPADVAELIAFLVDDARAATLSGVVLPVHSNE